jgi:hypothetical protein
MKNFLIIAGVPLLLSTAIFTLIGITAHNAGRLAEKQAAVDAKVAEWTIDSTGVKGFKYLTPKESPQ